MSIRDLQIEIDRTQAQILENENEFKKEAEEFSSDLINKGVSRVEQKINNALQGSIPILVSAAKSGNASLNARIQDIISPIAIDSIREILKSSSDKFKSRLHSILNTTFSNISISINLTTAGSGDIFKKGTFGAGLGLAVAFLVNPVLGIITGIASLFFGKSNNQDAQIEQQIVTSVIPGVLQQAHNSIVEALAKASKEIQKQLEETFKTKQDEIINSLKEIEKKKMDSEEIYEQTKTYWEKSIELINDLIIKLEETYG